MSSLSVAGLSAVLLYSTTVFVSIKFIGAAYLIYLGVKLWRFGFSSKQVISEKHDKNRFISTVSLYMQGLFISLSNPKAIAFTMALLPQFIDTSLPLFSQFFILATTFMLLSFCCLLAYGFAAKNLGRSKAVAKLSNIVSRAFGSAFVISGLVLVNTSSNKV